MPTNDFTSKLLGMEDAIIENTEVFNSHINIHFSLKRREHTCPCCGKHFYESFPQVPKHCHTTLRLTMYTISLLANKSSARDIAKAVGVSDHSYESERA